MIYDVKFNFNSEKEKKLFQYDYEYFPEKVKIKSLEFKPGINVLVGGNGCGKTSIINILRELTFCRYGFYSKLALHSGDSCFQYEITNQLMKDVDVTMDYDRTTFNLFNVKFCDKQGSDADQMMKFNSAADALQQRLSYFSRSDGESVLGDLSQLFAYMFKPGHCVNPIFDKSELEESVSKKMVNDFWFPILSNMLEYTKTHHRDSNGITTVLMDEPDKGLDILNLKELLGILTSPRDDTQIIAAIHNPLLLIKLINCEYVNIIEIEPGYLDRMKRFLSEILEIDYDKLFSKRRNLDENKN